MRKTMWLFTVLVIALGATALAQSGQPSLADIARQTRQEQKPSVTITNDDFPSTNAGGSGTAVHPADGAQPSSSAPAADKKKDDSNAGPQTKKPADIAELKKKLASYKQERDVWKQSADQYEQKLAKETSQFRRDVYQEALENDRKNVVLYQARINKTEAQIADAESSSSKPNTAGPPSTNGPRP